jgi:hypothetical protein
LPRYPHPVCVAFVGPGLLLFLLKRIVPWPLRDKSVKGFALHKKPGRGYYQPETFTRLRPIRSPPSRLAPALQRAGVGLMTGGRTERMTHLDAAIISPSLRNLHRWHLRRQLPSRRFPNRILHSTRFQALHLCLHLPGHRRSKRPRKRRYARALSQAQVTLTARQKP